MGALRLIAHLGLAAVTILGATRAQAYFEGRELGSIGFYSSGCLDSSRRIEGTEAGLLKLFVERERWFGNPMMIELLRDLGQAYSQEWQRNATPAAERIQLGDISQRGGGRMTKHASHQIGLDVDIVYMRRDHRETAPKRGFDASFDELFVKRNKLTRNLDTVRQWWVWKWLERTGKVDRIFVDPRIKQYFCNHASRLEPGDKVLRTQILRMLRPWPGHRDHFHLRLVCPPDDTKCIGSPPVPEGSGCRALELAELEDGPDVDNLFLARRVHHSGSHALPKECSRHGSFPEPRLYEFGL